MKTLRLLRIAGSLGLALGFASNNAQALGVAAGTDINNTASVTYDVGSVSTTTNSNQVTVRVAEILDVVVTRQSAPTISVTAGANAQAVLFRVTNSGNGSETFRLVMNSVIGGDDFDPTAASPAIYFDTDGSNSLTAGDTPYVVGTNDPVLLADAFVNMLVVNNMPASIVDGNQGITRLTADSRTGTGAPGTTFAGLGDAGTDAVVGTSGADSEDTGRYLVSGITLSVTKSQAVVDQFGGSRPVPGARINYTISVTATGSGSATAAVFNDAIPVNTTYVAGTLRLNAGVLSDTADADAGAFVAAPASVSVQLGTITQASTHTIEFAVTIN